MEDKKIKEFVKERYSKIATNGEDSCGCSCCGGSKYNPAWQKKAELN